jgi:hypothetical protein
MGRSSKILKQFKGFFGERGGDQIPANTGPGRHLVQLCREALATPVPVLFDYFADWHSRPNATPVLVAHELLKRGLLEAAWDVVQLHPDQTQKKEAADKMRLHKGDPFCGMAILGQALGSHTLVRHFAQLSSIGDVCWERVLTDLRHGGLAPTIMEAYESKERQDLWRAQVRKRMPKNGPRYLEPFLLMRWFGPAYWNLFINASKVEGRRGLPFAEVLLDMIEAPGTKQKGKLFEAATALLVSATPGFEVRSARKTTDEQVDLVVRYERDPLTILPLAPGPGLIECKSSNEPVAVNELRDFGAKCLFHRVGFGILVTRANITGSGKNLFSDPQYAELVRRRFLVDGLTILVIDIADLRGRAVQLRCLQEPLASDHDNVFFGPIDGATESA